MEVFICKGLRMKQGEGEVRETPLPESWCGHYETLAFNWPERNRYSVFFFLKHAGSPQWKPSTVITCVLFCQWHNSGHLTDLMSVKKETKKVCLCLAMYAWKFRVSFGQLRTLVLLVVVVGGGRRNMICNIVYIKVLCFLLAQFRVFKLTV